MCCGCARVFVKDGMDTDHDTPITWVKAFPDGRRFLGMNRDTAVKVMGLDTYHREYGVRDKGAVDRAFIEEEFHEWQVTASFEGQTERLLCCPEDRLCKVCQSSSSDIRDTALCSECTLPVCKECNADFSKGKRPKLSLSNDMWFGYIPDMIYKKNVTYMELLCASVCSPCMLSVQLEKYGFDLRKEKVHQQEHRVGARGNMVAFMFPLEDFLAELKRLHEKPEEIQLPLTGEQLQKVVQVVLMAQKEATHEGVPTADLQRFLTTATVRADVVVELIEEGRRRGNPLYTRLDMEKVRERACLLPREAAVPPEVMVMLKKTMRIEKRRGGKANPKLHCIT